MRLVSWGEVPYVEAVERQLDVLNDVAHGAEDTIVFCTHPPVVTKGRATRPHDITTWQGEVVETSRGGRATYHGPSQVVMYPIVHLNRDCAIGKKKELHQYLRDLEAAVIQALGGFGIEATVRKDKVMDEHGDELLLTGVWTKERKVASLGVAVKNWVTYHGMALNLFKDSAAFTGMNPCGFPATTMVSLEELLGGAEMPSRQEMERILFDEFQQIRIGSCLMKPEVQL